QCILGKFYKTNGRWGIRDNVFVFLRDFDQQTRYKIDVGIIGNAHRDPKPDNISVKAQISNVLGDKLAVRDNDGNIVVCFNSGASSSDRRHLTKHFGDLYPVANFDRPLEEDDKAADKIIGDILQTQPDSYTYRAGQDVHCREIYPDRLQND